MQPFWYWVDVNTIKTILNETSHAMEAKSLKCLIIHEKLNFKGLKSLKYTKNNRLYLYWYSEMEICCLQSFKSSEKLERRSPWRLPYVVGEHQSLVRCRCALYNEQQILFQTFIQHNYKKYWVKYLLVFGLLNLVFK